MALRGPGWPTGQRGAARAEQGVRRGFWAEEEEGSASGPGWSERQGGTRATRGERFQRAERVGGKGSLGHVGSGPLRERLLGRALGEAGPSVCGWKRAQAV